MASDLYNSVMKNDAKRDALRKKPAKPGMHPRSDPDTARRAKKAKDRQAEIAARRSGNGSNGSQSANAAEVKRTPPSSGKPKQPAHPPSTRSAESYQRQGAKTATKTTSSNSRDTPTSALGPRRPATGSPGTTAALAGAGGNGKALDRSALGPQRPAGGSESFLSGITNYMAQTRAANQKRWEDTVAAGKDVGAAKPSPQSATAAETPKPTPVTPAPDRANRGENARPTPAGQPAKKSTSARPKPRNVDNREVAPKTTVQYKGDAAPKPLGAPRQIHPTPGVGSRNVAALRAQSKASLADSKASAAARKPGPGGGAETVLQSYRGNTSHFTKREK